MASENLIQDIIILQKENRLKTVLTIRIFKFNYATVFDTLIK